MIAPRHWMLFLAASAALNLGVDDGTPDDFANGFDLSASSIPRAEIHVGGPPRDGIAALVAPALLDTTSAPWSETDFVIGVEIDGEARAYPISILEWHELVNDTLGGAPILVSWCPLCGSALVFDRRIESRVLEFGVSGLLYQSDLLMFDRETESLWSQIAARAVSGEFRGSRLRIVPSKMTTWRHWKQLHPETKVLSGETGHKRNYTDAAAPYGSYAVSSMLRFPAKFETLYHPKEPTLGVRASAGAARAYPRIEVHQAGGCIVEDFGGQRLRIEWNESERSFASRVGPSSRTPLKARNDAPPQIEVIEAYWFAWSAFHPQTTVFEAAGAVACPNKLAVPAPLQ